MAGQKKHEKNTSKKYALLATCGTTPQIITEALWALNNNGQMPTTIKIITTTEGQKKCIEQLLGDDGNYSKLISVLNIPGAPSLKSADIVVPHTPDGKEIQFVSNEIENQAFLELCIEEAFKITSRFDTEVIFLINGGTANMSASLSIAAQLYGKVTGTEGRDRKKLYTITDRVCSVYVVPYITAERNKDFFFPKPGDEEVVKFIEYPLLSVRNKMMPRHLTESNSSFGQLISFFNTHREIALHKESNTFEWGSVLCRLERKHFAILWFLLVNKDITLLPPLAYDDNDIRNINRKASERFKNFIINNRIQLAGGEDALVSMKLDSDLVNQYVSKIQDDFNFHFGPNSFILTVNNGKFKTTIKKDTGRQIKSVSRYSYLISNGNFRVL